MQAYYSAMDASPTSFQRLRRGLLQRFPALAGARYRRYWLASLASVGGTQLMILAQGWLVFELTGSALQLGLLGAAAALPNILMTLVGGVIADRFDKRRIMLYTSSLTAVLLFLLAWLDYREVVALWHVLAIAAAVSLITGLDWPSRVALLPELVPRPAIMSAVALNAVVWQVTRMAMPALGGLLLVWSEPWLLFLLGGLGFVVMFGVMLTLHIQVLVSGRESPLEQLLEGLRFIWRKPLFRWLIIVNFTGMFFAQSYVQVMPVFADLMGRAEAGYGTLVSATGIGSVVGTLLLGAADEQRRLGWIMLGGAALQALTLMLFAGTAYLGLFWIAAGTAFLASVFASGFMIGSMTTLQMSVPDALRGRVMGIHTIGFSLPPLGGLWLGALGNGLTPVVGSRPAIGVALTTGCILYLLMAGWVIWRQPGIRRLDGGILVSDGTPEPAPVRIEPRPEAGIK